MFNGQVMLIYILTFKVTLSQEIFLAIPAPRHHFAARPFTCHWFPRSVHLLPYSFFSIPRCTALPCNDFRGLQHNYNKCVIRVDVWTWCEKRCKEGKQKYKSSVISKDVKRLNPVNVIILRIWYVSYDISNAFDGIYAKLSEGRDSRW